MNRIKKLFSNTFLFAISNFGSKVISFLLIPIYTSVLSTEQYGTIDVILTSVALSLPLVTLGMSDAVLRFSMEPETDRKSIFSTGLSVVIIGYLASLLPIILLIYYLKVSEHMLPMLILLFFNSIYQFVSQFCRGISKIIHFSIAGLLQTIIFMLTNILMVLVFSMGVFGYLLSASIAFAVPIIYLTVAAKLYKYIGGRFNKALFKEMIKYSLPLIPNTLFWWVMNSSDKLFISQMLGKSYNGLYAIANKLPSIINTISIVFFQAWQLSAIEEVNSDDKGEYYEKVFDNLSSVILLSVAAILAVIKPVFRIWVAEEYFTAWVSSPLLLIAVTFMCFTSFWGTILIAQKKTVGILISATVGCVVNVCLNFLLIPRYELIGAAVATICGFAATWACRIFEGNRSVKIRIKWQKQIVSFAAIALQITALYLSWSFIVPAALVLVVVFVNRSTILLMLRMVKLIGEKLFLKRAKK